MSAEITQSRQRATTGTECFAVLKMHVLIKILIGTQIRRCHPPPPLYFSFKTFYIMGAACSRSRSVSDEPPADASNQFAVLRKLDQRLLSKLEDKTIRLLRTSWLVSQSVLRDRKSLEALEAEGQSPFLSPAEAIEVVLRGQRGIAVLSYGWLGKNHPDGEGTLLAIVKRHLAGKTLKFADMHVVGLFWECARSRHLNFAHSL